MTRDEIMTMNLGRELDALVAKTVMGWTFSDLIKSWYPPNLRPENNAYGHKLPNYSTDISAAWEVFKKIPYEICIWKSDNGYICGIYDGKVNSDICEVETDTAPEAIVKAALLAVMGVE